MAERSLHLQTSLLPNTLTGRSGQARMARVSGKPRSSLAGARAAGNELPPPSHVALGGRLGRVARPGRERRVDGRVFEPVQAACAHGLDLLGPLGEVLPRVEEGELARFPHVERAQVATVAQTTLVGASSWRPYLNLVPTIHHTSTSTAISNSWTSLAR